MNGEMVIVALYICKPFNGEMVWRPFIAAIRFFCRRDRVSAIAEQPFDISQRASYDWSSQQQQPQQNHDLLMKTNR